MTAQPGSRDFFVAGGTLWREAPSYIVRPADRDLLAATLAGEYCHVLAARQMGKSSLGVAHDFNNLLHSIQGRCALIRTEIQDNKEVCKQLDFIEDNVRSAASLTRSLLGYTRGGEHQRKALDLNRLVEQTLETFGRTCKQIQIHTRLSSGSEAVLGDRYQLEQMLANLSVNALQAMPNGGSLTVATEPCVFDGASAGGLGIAPGRYVKLCLSDTGEGIDPAIQDKIFNPFFTTRPPGKGTGLGLASVLEIVKGHNGAIQVDSAPGRGTTFAVHLPAAAVRENRETAARSDIHTGSGRVLLVDDEPMVLEVGAQMLRKLGYEVVQASGGREALGICQEGKEALDVIILDMVMPAMGGEQTFAALKEICPHTPVVLSSGYSLDDKTRRLLDQGAFGFLQKPFGMQALSQLMGKVLSPK